MATEFAKTARADEDPRNRDRSRVSVTAFLDQAADAALVFADERTEEALRRSEASFRALIELLPDGVVVHRGGRILYINPEGVSRLGYDAAAELVGRPVADIIHPDDRAEVASRLALIAATGEPLEMREDRFLKRDGSTCQAEVVALQVIFDGAPDLKIFARADSVDSLSVSPKATRWKPPSPSPSLPLPKRSPRDARASSSSTTIGPCAPPSRPCSRIATTCSPPTPVLRRLAR